MTIAIAADPTVALLLALTAALGFGGSALLLGAPPIPWRYWTPWLRRMARMQGWALGGVLLGLVLSVLPFVDAAARLWVGLAGGSGALLIGLVTSGHEARRHQATQRALERQVLDLARYLRIRLGAEGDVAILSDYLRRPEARRSAMQRLVRCALERHRRQARGSVWEALHAEAEAYGAPLVIEFTRSLATVADRDRSQMAQVAEHMDQRMTRALLDEVQRRQQRAELVVTVATAGTLVCGLLGLIIFVMTGGLTLGDLLPATGE